MDPAQLLGPLGLTVGLIIAVYAFFTGKVRRESEVIERDKRIEVLTSELAAERAAKSEEQRLKREYKAVATEVIPEKAQPPLV